MARVDSLFNDNDISPPASAADGAATVLTPFTAASHIEELEPGRLHLQRPTSQVFGGRAIQATANHRRSSSSPAIFQTALAEEMDKDWEAMLGKDSSTMTVNSSAAGDGDDFNSEDADPAQEALVAQCLSDFLETAVPESLPGNFNAEVCDWW